MFRHDGERRIEEQAGRAWDAIASGGAPDPGGLDPTLLETMRRLQALGARPRPDASFANRLEAQLVQTLAAADLAPPTQNPGLTAVSNGRKVWARPGAAVPPVSPRWTLSQLATAALVLLTLVSSFVVFGGPLRPGSHGERPAFIPAPDGAPTSILPPGITEDTVLMQGTFDEIPEEPIYAGLVQTTIAPGAVVPLGKSENNGVGPLLFRVESGVLTVQADGPVTVTRAGARVPEKVMSGEKIALNIGDNALTPSGTASRWQNTGTTPVPVMRFEITTPGSSLPSDETIADEWWVRLPAMPLMAAVRRLTIAPGGSFASADLPGAELLAVENGTLIATDPEGLGTPVNPFDIRVASATNLSFPAGRVFQNPSAEPLTLLLVTLAPVPSEATPMA